METYASLEILFFCTEDLGLRTEDCIYLVLTLVE
jgi:hypothetical protein